MLWIIGAVLPVEWLVVTGLALVAEESATAAVLVAVAAGESVERVRRSAPERRLTHPPVSTR